MPNGTTNQAVTIVDFLSNGLVVVGRAFYNKIMEELNEIEDWVYELPATGWRSLSNAEELAILGKDMVLKGLSIEYVKKVINDIMNIQWRELTD